jgi:DNA (cytosine-5)-methyltransferase 1
MMSFRPKIFSFFAGSGFLDLGFETSGFDVVYVNEVFAPFINAYRYSRASLDLKEPKYGYDESDVRKLVEDAEGKRFRGIVEDCRKSSNIIGFIGGPPCPDFSVGGKNRGYLGDNGQLSSVYIELICHTRPDLFLFENVKGLWKTKKHRLFYDSLKLKLQEAGYILSERLINAIEYGVPQNRERIILIGFHQGLFKLQKIKWLDYILYHQDKVFSLPWSQSDLFQANSQLICPQSIIPELTVEYWFLKNNVLNHPHAKYYFKPKAGLDKMSAIAEGDDSRKSFKRLHRWRYSPTACYGNNEVHLHPYQIRRISVAEALAIQSLPANFLLPENMSLTNMFKTIGNGVPYLAAKAIAKSILDLININY